MKIDQLIVWSEGASCPSQIKLAINSILNSINDWPDSIGNLSDFLAAVESFVGTPVTKASLDCRLHSISILDYAWNVESLMWIQELFDYYDEEVSLNEIFQSIESSITSAK